MILLESSVSGRFIENQSAGELFVITGKVKNAGSFPQTGCRVSAELHAKENLVLQTDTVYCGNLLTETELLNLDIEHIVRMLKDPPDRSESNLAVNPGAAVPFTIVFHDPPEHFDSFKVGVYDDS